MYGTVVRYRLKPGGLEQLQAWVEDDPGPQMPGVMVAYQMDRDPNELLVAIAAPSEEEYRATSESPEMHERYLKMLEFMAAEPEWNDGTIIAHRFNLPDTDGLYGSISMQRIKPGKVDELMAWGEANQLADEDRPGAMIIYQMDRDPNELYGVIVAESESAYRTTSESPEMHERYLKMLEFFEGEPIWNDGHIIAAQVNL